jgi:hypothetical protein
LTFRLLVVASAIAAALSAGCSGVSCDAPQCPKDPRPLAAMITTCNNAHSNKCSGHYDNWVQCIDVATKCNPVSQTSDPVSHKDAYDECKPKYATYVACASTL